MQRCYNLLTNDEIRMIHEASLDVLQTTGLRFNHPAALEKLSDAGAQVDAAKEQVRLPAEMVEKALKTAPKNFICAGVGPPISMCLWRPDRRQYRSFVPEPVSSIITTSCAIYTAQSQPGTAGMWHYWWML